MHDLHSKYSRSQSNKNYQSDEIQHNNNSTFNPVIEASGSNPRENCRPFVVQNERSQILSGCFFYTLWAGTTTVRTILIRRDYHRRQPIDMSDFKSFVDKVVKSLKIHSTNTTTLYTGNLAYPFKLSVHYYSFTLLKPPFQFFLQASSCRCRRSVRLQILSSYQIRSNSQQTHYHCLIEVSIQATSSNIHSFFVVLYMVLYTIVNMAVYKHCIILLFTTVKFVLIQCSYLSFHPK